MSRLLALDIGMRRTGVAFCDTETTGIALPLDTIAHASLEEFVEKVSALAHERRATQLIIGLPKLPSGDEGEQARIVRSFTDALAPLSLPITFVDERLSSKLPAGTASHVDDNAAAATHILMTYLGH